MNQTCIRLPFMKTFTEKVQRQTALNDQDDHISILPKNSWKIACNLVFILQTLNDFKPGPLRQNDLRDAGEGGHQDVNNFGFAPSLTRLKDNGRATDQPGLLTAGGAFISARACSR